MSNSTPKTSNTSIVPLTLRYFLYLTLPQPLCKGAVKLLQFMNIN